MPRSGGIRRRAHLRIQRCKDVYFGTTQRVQCVKPTSFHRRGAEAKSRQCYRQHRRRPHRFRARRRARRCRCTAAGCCTAIGPVGGVESDEVGLSHENALAARRAIVLAPVLL